MSVKQISIKLQIHSVNLILFHPQWPHSYHQRNNWSEPPSAKVTLAGQREALFKVDVLPDKVVLTMPVHVVPSLSSIAELDYCVGKAL